MVWWSSRCTAQMMPCGSQFLQQIVHEDSSFGAQVVQAGNDFWNSISAGGHGGRDGVPDLVTGCVDCWRDE